MAYIPERLRCQDFRFIEIPRGEKGPKIRGWQSESCKPFNDFTLWRHLQGGGNYGVVLGYGGLIVVDIDDLSSLGLASALLPQTFTVRTGRSGLHLYYKCDEIESCIRLQQPGGSMGGIGDIKATGGQVVGPTSEHPNGNLYEVEKDVPIANITAKRLESILGKYYVRRRKPVVATATINHDDGFRVMDLLSGAELYHNGAQLRGPHPVHGSTNGMNFSVNPDKNVWFCFRHGTGGGPWHLLAMMEGLLDCEMCGAGSIDKDLFKELTHIAKKRGLIE